MLVGIVMCTMANVGINLGTNIIKLAFNRRQNEVEKLLELEKSVPFDGKDEINSPPQLNGHGNSRASVNALSRISSGGGKANPRNSLVLNPLRVIDEEGTDGGEVSKGKEYKAGDKVKPIYKWRSWQGGFLIFKLSNVVNFVSLGFGKQSVLASLSSVQFVSNLVFCYFVLHERLRLNDIMGTVSIITGVVICIVANSSGGEKVYTVNELISLTQKRPYLIYLGVLVAMAMLAYMTFTGNFFFFKLDDSSDSGKSDGGGKNEGNKNGGGRQDNYLSSMGTDMSPVKDTHSMGDVFGSKISFVNLETIRPLCFATYSAVIGTQVVTFAKITMLQIRLSIDGEQQFDKVATYLFIIGMIFTGVFWDKQINLGLRKFDALLIVPLMQSLWTILAICNGGMFFQEFQALSTKQILLFCSGMLVMLFGMCLLMWHEEDIYMDDLEFVSPDEEEMVDEDDLNRVQLKESSEKKLLRRRSISASILLYADQVTDGVMASMYMQNKNAPLKKTQSSKQVENPLMDEGGDKEDKTDAEAMDDSITMPKIARRQTQRRVTLVSKSSGSGPRNKAMSTSHSFETRSNSGGHRKSKAVGRIRTLSMASAMASFGTMRVPSLDMIMESDG